MELQSLDPRSSGEYIAKLSTNKVVIRKEGIASLSERIFDELIKKPIATNYFTESAVHPRSTDSRAADWIFFKNTVGSCLWSGKSDRQRGWEVWYQGKPRHGYFALCAAIKIAKESGRWGDITDPAIYSGLKKEDLAKIFQGNRKRAPLGLLRERAQDLNEVGTILRQKYSGTFENVIRSSNGSAIALLKIIVQEFPSFRDEAIYKGQKVSFYKKAQTVISDLWNCFEGKGLGAFHDMDSLTMLADYRVPQSLVYFGVLKYSNELKDKIKRGELLENGSEDEVEIRGCSIHAVELLCSEVRNLLEERGMDCHINPISVDNYLWECRRKEKKRIARAEIPKHKTICNFY